MVIDIAKYQKRILNSASNRLKKIVDINQAMIELREVTNESRVKYSDFISYLKSL
jgi:hypothetical protein